MSASPAAKADEEETRKRYTTAKAPVVRLDCKRAWEGLSKKEQLYAHHFSQAAWWGSPIVLEQTSVESPAIFQLFLRLFSEGNSISALRAAVTRAGTATDEEFDALLCYAATFFANMGNYLSFGDTKFIPNLAPEKFGAIVDCAAKDAADLSALYASVKEDIYSLDAKKRALGLGEEGCSNYYSANIERADIDFVTEYMNENNVSGYNTRLFKNASGELELRFASAEKRTSSATHKGRTIKLVYGDHAEELERVASCLERALPHAANPNQSNMLSKYIASFRNGSIEDHKDSQRYWIKDQGPAVETNMGFIESYRDPIGIRGEWEGFVAVVDKAVSGRFNQLVTEAERLIAMMPWPKEFEKDSFKRPDFTSLDVVTFASSGIPAGINIPNYDDIRQTEGFKNVSLGNVLSARKADERVTFIADEDQAVFRSLIIASFEVQVGIHELLGHGSGKLLMEETAGKFNFDRKTINPVTGKQVETWYKPGETWTSKFPAICSSYEECRAEACGIFLCVKPEILKIFGHEGQEADDVMYVNWLSMARAGLVGMEFYDADNKAWKQAHMQARFAILRVLLEAGQDFVQIVRTPNDITVKLDRSKILSVGLPAMDAFLMKLNVFKATGDFERGKQMYDHYTRVPADYLELRKIVLAQKKPRAMFVQAHTTLKGDSVELVEFEPSYEGMILSNTTRYAGYDFGSKLHKAPASPSTTAAATTTQATAAYPTGLAYQYTAPVAYAPQVYAPQIYAAPTYSVSPPFATQYAPSYPTIVSQAPIAMPQYYAPAPQPMPVPQFQSYGPVIAGPVYGGGAGAFAPAPQFGAPMWYGEQQPFGQFGGGYPHHHHHHRHGHGHRRHGHRHGY